MSVKYTEPVIENNKDSNYPTLGTSHWIMPFFCDYKALSSVKFVFPFKSIGSLKLPNVWGVWQLKIYLKKYIYY